MDTGPQNIEPVLIRSFVAKSVEVDSGNYIETLPVIFDAISNAAQSITATSEESYQTAKKVAQTYSILQVGLTILNHVDGSFECQTYHFKLSPMVKKEVNYLYAASEHLSRSVDRGITFSMQSMNFLERFGFNLTSAFSDGVPYLSRPERDAYRPHLIGYTTASGDSSSSDDKYEDNSPEGKLFCQSIHSRVKTWLKKRGKERYPKENDFINLCREANGGLNRFQLKLVHIIVRKSFPQCTSRSMSGGTFVQVTMKNEGKEAQALNKTTQMRRTVVAKNIGASLIFEALVGGEFANFYQDMWRDLGRDEQRNIVCPAVEECEARLKTRKPAIVAHNCLYDFCFIHQTFFGTLPESLDGFKDNIHELFPRFLDTKYMFLKGANSMSPDTGLQSCFQRCRAEQLPRMTWVTPDRYPTRDMNSFAAHDAGFDSYMTAMIIAKEGFKRAQKAIPGLPSPVTSPMLPTDSSSSSSMASLDTALPNLHLTHPSQQHSLRDDLSPGTTDDTSMTIEEMPADPGYPAIGNGQHPHSTHPRSAGGVFPQQPYVPAPNKWNHRQNHEAYMPYIPRGSSAVQPQVHYKAPPKAPSNAPSNPPSNATTGPRRRKRCAHNNATNQSPKPSHHHGHPPKSSLPGYMRSPRVPTEFQPPGPYRPVTISRPPNGKTPAKAETKTSNGGKMTLNTVLKTKGLEMDPKDSAFMPQWSTYLFREYGNTIPTGRFNFIEVGDK